MNLDHLLTECDPAPAGAVTAAEIDDALDALGRTIVAVPRRARRPSRRRFARARRVILVAAVLALAAGCVTAAKTLFIRTHTGTYVPKGMAVGGGPGEILRTDGTNFHQVAIALSADIPFPAGYLGWRDAVIAEEVKIQTWHKVPSGQLRGEYAQAAICAWILDWRVAMRSGDSARAARDASILARRPALARGQGLGSASRHLGARRQRHHAPERVRLGHPIHRGGAGGQPPAVGSTTGRRLLQRRVHGVRSRRRRVARAPAEPRAQ